MVLRKEVDVGVWERDINNNDSRTLFEGKFPSHMSLSQPEPLPGPLCRAALREPYLNHYYVCAAFVDSLMHHRQRPSLFLFSYK